MWTEREREGERVGGSPRSEHRLVFVHTMQVCNDWRLGRCSRSQCKFLHEEGTGGSSGARPPPFGRNAPTMDTSHRSGLPPRLLELFFKPRPVLVHLPPIQKKKQVTPCGVSSYLDRFAAPGDPEHAPEREQTANHLEERKKKKEERMAQHNRDVEEKLQQYDPYAGEGITEDPYKTLMVSRLPYTANEEKLQQIFAEFGPLRTIKVVKDVRTGKPRGYAFVEYEHKRDAKTAYKMTGSLKIEGKKVMVDVERARTVSGWKPRRLGGGLGGESRIAKPNKWQKRIDALAKANSPSKLPPAPMVTERSTHDGRRRDRSPPPSRREYSRERSGKDRYDGRRDYMEQNRTREREYNRDQGYDRYERNRTHRSRSPSLDLSWKRHKVSRRSRSRSPPKRRGYSPEPRQYKRPHIRPASPPQSPEEGEIV